MKQYRQPDTDCLSFAQHILNIAFNSYVGPEKQRPLLALFCKEGPGSIEELHNYPKGLFSVGGRV